MNRLLPGDILLTSHATEKAGSVIRAYQSGFFGEFDAQWSHVAIHVRNGVLVEAVPNGGVTRASVGDYVGQHRILARRLRDPRLRAEEFALCACLLIGKAYDRDMLVHFWRYATSSTYRKQTIFKKYTICTEVCAIAFQEAFRRSIADCPVDEPLTPAHLSASSEFTDVPLGWIKL